VGGVFQEIVRHYYRTRGRQLPWRGTDNPYHILVSEIMLQQTRVERVKDYYLRFIQTFPDFFALASAAVPEVMQEWSGLGYNRRAMALRETARMVVQDHRGILPRDIEVLRTFPGIGDTTAAAIVAFAFQHPSVFIETNIRTVFLFCFFSDRKMVGDREILSLIRATLPLSNPREWYYGLMDIGAMLKKECSIPKCRGSCRPRPRFEGSDRQARGRILSMLLDSTRLNERDLQKGLDLPPARLKKLLTELEDEGFLAHERDFWFFR
jgi:A/G-specific adenine glycosylase